MFRGFCCGVVWATLVAARVSQDVRVTVDLEGDVVKIDPHKLTAVTIDICALKLGLNFSDPLFATFASHLAPTILRIGGTDQNNFHYNVEDTRPMSPCLCGKSCTMTAHYWDEIHQFLNQTGLQLLFGLAPTSANNANELISYTAKKGYHSMFAYSYGNEQLGDSTLAQQYLKDMTQLRNNLMDLYPSGSTARPLLVGADIGVGPRRDTLPSNYWQDQYINEHLAYISLFVSICKDVLDAVSWHTYDYRASEIGTSDHHPLPWPPLADNVSKLFNPSYLAVAGKLSDNVSKAVATGGGKTSLPIWLTETNSVCHQGVFNDTNAFFNTLWLVNRLGMMAERGVEVMARQTLIGFNYSLLGNYPDEPMAPTPDYFTTLLFRQLVGSGSIPTTSDNVLVPTYSYCGRNGGVVMSFVSLDETADHDVAVPSALQPSRRLDYVLTPHWSGDTDANARTRATSRVVELNGSPLYVSAEGKLPSMVGQEATNKLSVYVSTLSVVLSFFPDVTANRC